jgi:hypothetical protein
VKIIEKLFLYKLLKADKALFVAVCLYLLGILYYAVHQREEFPFLLYGMYSLKEEPKSSYMTYSIELEGQEIKYAKLRSVQREMISSTLNLAIPLIEKGKIDSIDELKLKKWLMDYSGDMRLLGQNKMDVYRLTCNYNEAGKIQVLKKQLIYTYATD